jgi:phosphatidylserine/phosphatidylglycerophosphate/cardiolipin synthase-like enzyme
VTFTRGFVLSQAFIDRYGPESAFATLIPTKADLGLTFKATHPKTKEALEWMGFEARSAILEVLDEAIKDKKAKVCVVAYDLSEPDVVAKLVKLKDRVRIIIDDDGPHGEETSGETQSENLLVASAGRANVKRQHMGKLQHNKTIVVNSPTTKVAVNGSTNYSWRGFFVQSNNAIVVRGASAIKPFLAAFEDYWNNDSAEGFSKTESAKLVSLGLPGIDAQVGFSPYSSKNTLLKKIALDMEKNVTTSLLFSLAFLYQTDGPILKAVQKHQKNNKLFVYGISDKDIGGLDIQKPDGMVATVSPAALTKSNVPEPFKSEPRGGGGNRMHHKFVVIDFDKPTARVYLGSYNFSDAADTKNGENLMVIKDRRIAVSYVIEALRIFDHYHFRLLQQDAATAQKTLQLAKPPGENGDTPWFEEYYTNARKVRDRELFA